MTFIEPQQLESLPHSLFIVTEGIGDARFVDELLQFKGITNCSVGCPSIVSSGGSGKDAFPKYLASIQTARSRIKSIPLRGILVVADANGNAADSFETIVTAMRDATFPAPSRAFSIEEHGGLSVAVYLIPGEGETGTLENILLRAAFQKSPNFEKCLDDFSVCTGGLKSSKPNLQAKMRMSAVAATFCQDNPWCSPNTMWGDKNNPVPVNSACFNHICDFITRFAT